MTTYPPLPAPDTHVVVLHNGALYVCTVYHGVDLKGSGVFAVASFPTFSVFVLEPDREGITWVRGEDVNSHEVLAMKAAACL